MAPEETSISSKEIIPEKKILSNPKYQAVLSLIAYFQHHKKNIQRAHLIDALVKKPDPGSFQPDFMTDKEAKIIESEKDINNKRVLPEKCYADDNSTIEKSNITQIQLLGEMIPKTMFKSVAHLDKTVQHLRKLGLITNQYMRGYPRLILTHKGHMVFYTVIYPTFIFQTITQLINKLL